MIETTVCTFDVNVAYDDWVRKMNKDDPPARSAKGKRLFSEVSAKKIK